MVRSSMHGPSDRSTEGNTRPLPGADEIRSNFSELSISRLGRPSPQSFFDTASGAAGD
jgi:hypothetical protein